MLKRRNIALLAIFFLSVLPARAADNRVSASRIEPIKPVNVPPAAVRVVSGTVTVRLNGVLADPQSLTYQFAPEFPASNGRPTRIDEGQYFLSAGNVPADQSFDLNLFAAYNDTVWGRDGVIERRGKVYTGGTKIKVSSGNDTDIGVVFIDLR